jgi:antitoxin (DNA-binding transcriptional repressor) of toxin-antitoxin stability system
VHRAFEATRVFRALRSSDMSRSGLPILDLRDLQDRSAEVLRRVREGATFQVVDRGEVVAVLAPAASRSNLRMRPARVRGGFATLPRIQVETTTRALLDELRDR